MTNKHQRRAGIVGASGYSGQELLRILARHPSLTPVFATSEAEAGEAVPGTGLRYVRAEAAELSEADVVFTCLPHGESGQWALRAREEGALAVDLSGDLRDGAGGAVYGLPELWRSEVGGAGLVANPGCYPTGLLLALAPAMGSGLVDRTRPVVVNAASGVTGAGRTAKRELLFGEVAEDYRAYGVGNRHHHVPEIGRGLARLDSGVAPPFVFTPHLLPVRRGILETICLPVTEPVSAEAAAALWAEWYRGEPFVEILQAGVPALGRMVGRNSVSIGFSDVAGVAPPVLLVVVAFDNLVKGAAGQAVQNANLMLGFEETEGLSR
jgi:N-acetyl-gamma-glutamyl-phosphate reductase